MIDLASTSARERAPCGLWQEEQDIVPDSEARVASRSGWRERFIASARTSKWHAKHVEGSSALARSRSRPPCTEWQPVQETSCASWALPLQKLRRVSRPWQRMHASAPRSAPAVLKLSTCAGSPVCAWAEAPTWHVSQLARAERAARA
ncbi:MAG TPA: hypothetical protein VFM93_14005 [Candidatus Limnocylindria bacterium]|nr:hypothetical protein [Candidatus Limnocylindria bacterium]